MDNHHRARTRVRALLLAAYFMAGTSGAAMAACSASPTVGINFDCDGISFNTGTVVNPGSNPSISGEDTNAAFVLAPDSDFTNNGDITVSFDASALTGTAGVAGYYRTRLYGIVANDAGEYHITNALTGIINV
jgi:hypothetical protein